MATRKFLAHLDLNQNQLQNAVIHPLSTAPANPYIGQVYFNTTTELYYIYTSEGWKAFKYRQTAKTDPTASGTSITFIDSITQNENGEISATKKTVATGTTSSTVAAGNHTHGDITNGGDITATGVTIATGDALVIRDASASKLEKTSITFDTTKSDYYLSEAGTWEVIPAGSLAGLSDTTISSATNGDILRYNGTSWVNVNSIGNINTLDGTLQTNDITIANGDKLVVTDADNSNKIARTSTAFDGTTTTKYLSKAGTWVDHTDEKLGLTIIPAATTSTGKYYDIISTDSDDETKTSAKTRNYTTYLRYHQALSGLNQKVSLNIGASSGVVPQIEFTRGNSTTTISKPISTSDNTLTLPTATGTLALTSDITVTDVQVNGTSVVSSKTANIVTNTAYNASSNKIATMSDLPTVNNGQLSIGVTSGSYTSTDATTFTANQSGNSSISIHIPEKDSHLTNDRYVRYDTASQGLTSTQKSNARTNIGASDFSGSWNDLTDKPTDGTATIATETNDIITIKGGVIQSDLTIDNAAGLSDVVLAKVAKTGEYSDLSNKPTLGTAAAKDYTTSVTSGSTDLVTSGAVYTAIDNLPEPMIFKGSVGTSATITWASLPSPAASNEGFTYKVVTDYTNTGASDYRPTSKVGDTIISNGSAWVNIPSGDEPSGTVTSVATGTGLTGGPITSSGTISHADIETTTAVSTAALKKITTDGIGHIKTTADAVLNDLSNVNTGASGNTLNDGDALVYDSQNQQWINTAISGTDEKLKVSAISGVSGYSTVTYDILATSTPVDETTASTRKYSEDVRINQIGGDTVYYTELQVGGTGNAEDGYIKASTADDSYNSVLGPSDLTFNATNGTTVLYPNTNLSSDITLNLPVSSGTLALTTDIYPTAICYFKTSNSQLTTSLGSCTWEIPASTFSSQYPTGKTADFTTAIVSVREVSTGAEVYTEVNYAANTLTIKINSDSNIAANTYVAVIHTGLVAAS